jgi:hypothetical protein
MSTGKVFRSIFVAGSKFLIFAAVVYGVCAVGLRIHEASSPSSKDICGRVQLGMTVNQVEQVATTFEGWQVLRDDGVFVISTRSYRDKSPVCRVAIDPSTHRATSKSTGPLQRGDWPTL